MNEIAIFLAVLALIVTVVILVLSFRWRLFVDIAVRNAFRRRLQTVLIVLGLMVGTSIISGSMVMGDTLENIFVMDVYNSLGEIDEIILAHAPSGGYRFFTWETYLELKDVLLSDTKVDGVASLVLTEASICLLRNGHPSAISPGSMLLGVNASEWKNFGSSSNPLSLDLAVRNGIVEVAANRFLVRELNCRVDDLLLINTGGKNFTGRVVKVFRRDAGEPNLFNGRNLIVPQWFLQDFLGIDERVNAIAISNAGNERSGMKHSKRVAEEAERVLDDAIDIRDLGLHLNVVNSSYVLHMTLPNGSYTPYPVELAHLFGRCAVNASPLLGLPVPVISFGPLGKVTMTGIEGSAGSISISIPLGTLYVGRDLFEKINYTEVSVRYSGSAGQGYRSFSVVLEELPFPGAICNLTEAHEMVFGSPDVHFVGFAAVNTTVPLSHVATEMNASLTSRDMNAKVLEIKREQFEAALEGADNIKSIFLVLGLFSIAAGIMLAIHIFVMLGEERKMEMGVTRAIGVKRRHLVLMYLTEGSVYAMIASSLGTIIGVGIGYVIVYVEMLIFAPEEIGEVSLLDLFSVTSSSLVIAFAVGYLVSLIAITLTAWRISRMEIIDAIKDLPSERERLALFRILGVIGSISGLLITLAGVALGGIALIIGPCILILGISPFLARKTGFPRLVYSISGTIILIWALDPLRIAGGGELINFFFQGMLLVTGAMVIILYNSESILRRIAELMGKTSRTAVLKTALAYPLRSPGRNGLTMAMIALIVYTITTISLWNSIFATAVDNIMKDETGGYQLIATLPPDTVFDLQTALMQSRLADNFIPPDMGGIVGLSEVPMAEVDSGGKRTIYPVLGVDDEFLIYSDFKFAEREGRRLIAKGFSYLDSEGKWAVIRTEKDVWRALRENASLCIGDLFTYRQSQGEWGETSSPRLKLGQTFTVRDPVVGDGINLTFIGVLRTSMFIRGIIVNKRSLVHFGSPSNSTYLLTLRDASLLHTKEVARALERTFASRGLDVTVMEEEILEVAKQIRSVMRLVEAYLALGLIIGISGLAIVAMRTLRERRQQIGMLRAVGFTRRAVLQAFLLEFLFIASFAIFTGMVLGVISMYNMYLSIPEDMNVDFVVNWIEILLMASVILLSTLVFVFHPARRAASLSPAEALRYVE